MERRRLEGGILRHEMSQTLDSDQGLRKYTGNSTNIQ